MYINEQWSVTLSAPGSASTTIRQPNDAEYDQSMIGSEFRCEIVLLDRPVTELHSARVLYVGSNIDRVRARELTASVHLYYAITSREHYSIREHVHGFEVGGVTRRGAPKADFPPRVLWCPVPERARWVTRSCGTDPAHGSGGEHDCEWCGYDLTAGFCHSCGMNCIPVHIVRDPDDCSSSNTYCRDCDPLSLASSLASFLDEEEV